MSQEWNSNSTGDENVQDLGAEASASPVDSGTGRKFIRANSSTLTLVLAFATAVGLLYLLGLHNRPRAADANTAQHDAKRDAVINDLLKNTNTQANVKSFYDDTNRIIALVDGFCNTEPKSVDLDGNPFSHHEDAAPVQDTTSHAAPVVSSDDPNLRRVSEEFSAFKVQTVMTGASPAAIVNDQIVTIGSTLGSFNVLDIKPDHLVLGWQDKKFTLPVGGQQLKNH